ncbi:MAG: hypothetical protein MJA29_14415 [Candidatus Omnitrophica bacterium]|nr:hypothetical protein [Candidatus Omnitrophota bacterium]
MMHKIVGELKHHMPFTALGAACGIFFMIIFRDMPEHTAHELFYVFHPLHVLLSALVTASLFHLHTCPRGEGRRCNLPLLFFIGLAGSVGIATLSDSIVPYLGEVILDLPHRHHHIGFLEKWWLIAGVAVVGVVIAYFNPSTTFPHAGHVLISTWASVFHIIMAKGSNLSWGAYAGIFVFLFLAVWLPCCISDIVFPMLFVRKKS